MKSFHSIKILVVSAMLLVASCNTSDKSKTPEKEVPLPKLDLTVPPGGQGLKAAEPAQNAAGVWHYTCSKGCAGGAGVAGSCTTCGNALAHNQTYHGNANALPTITNPIANTNTNLPEPAQNAAGVWHYTCNSGCTGGAGAAGNCTSCGSTLAHNAAYH